MFTKISLILLKIIELGDLEEQLTQIKRIH